MSRLDAAFALVSIPSVSRDEAAIATFVETQLRAAEFLDVVRVGDNVVARTNLGRAERIIVAGHLDTVPGDARAATRDASAVRGVGACDMKGSLAVMLELALDPTPRSVDVSWIFYAREEIARSESGLEELLEQRPDLLVGDVALLAEPTGGVVEAGCQGNLRVEITLRGRRAHSARPFTGRNAIHRAGEMITRVAAYEPRQASLDGVTFTEQLQTVFIHGGVAGNVVPDEVTLTLNHRVAPDRTMDEAVQWLRDYLAEFLEDGDVFNVLDQAPNAVPDLTNERLAALVKLTHQPARAKEGWTDVATFQALSIPSTNFGAGDPLLAHRSDEFVTESELDTFASILREWLS